MSLEFYCRNCRIPFCKNCLYFEHRAHDYVNVSLVKTGIERETEKMLENLNQSCDAIQQRQLSLGSILAEILENEKTSLVKVGIAFDYILDKLICQRKIAEHEIKERTKEENQKIGILIQQSSKPQRK